MDKDNKNTKLDNTDKKLHISDVSSSVPTQWAKVEEIETWVGGDLCEGKGGRARLIVTHYCGDNKKDLIGQLETLIYGLKNGFEDFAS